MKEPSSNGKKVGLFQRRKIRNELRAIELKALKHKTRMALLVKVGRGSSELAYLHQGLYHRYMARAAEIRAEYEKEITL